MNLPCYGVALKFLSFIRSQAKQQKQEQINSNDLNSMVLNRLWTASHSLSPKFGLLLAIRKISNIVVVISIIVVRYASDYIRF